MITKFSEGDYIYVTSGIFKGFAGVVRDSYVSTDTNTGLESEWVTVDLSLDSLSPIEVSNFYLESYGGSLDYEVELNNIVLDSRSLIKILSPFTQKEVYELIFKFTDSDTNVTKRCTTLFENKLNAYIEARNAFNQHIKSYNVSVMGYIYTYNNHKLECFQDENSFGLRCDDPLIIFEMRIEKKGLM